MVLLKRIGVSIVSGYTKLNDAFLSSPLGIGLDVNVAVLKQCKWIPPVVFVPDLVYSEEVIVIYVGVKTQLKLGLEVVLSLVGLVHTLVDIL